MSTPQGLYVPSGKIRFEEELMIWGPIPLQIKISTDDTDGALFIFEPTFRTDKRAQAQLLVAACNMLVQY